jgi:hypothetical protein
MKPGFICVAGVEPETGRQIRPVQGHCFTRDFLRLYGGPFEIGGAVDLGPTRCVGHAPEWEDHRVETRNLRFLGRITASDFWSVLCKTNSSSLLALFGRELQQGKRDQSCTTAENTGRASLGHLSPAKPASITVDYWGKLRGILADQDFHPEVSVTDIRLCRSDNQTPRLRLIEDVATRLQSVPAVLAVGLTRPFQKSPDDPPRHWLQLNNIHLQDDPLGDSLPPPTTISNSPRPVSNGATNLALKKSPY